MEIKKIFVDMDGVLADFHEGTRCICNIDPITQTSTVSDQPMWDAIRDTDHFYRKLYPVEGAVDMVKELVSRFGDKVEILSAVPKPHRGIATAKEDKLEWVAEYYPEITKINIVYRAEKKNFCEGPDCILIDDFDKNVNEWIENGGTAILFESAKQAISELNKLLGE